MHKYIIISPVRDEEEHIEKTILSVVGQAVQPVEWILVNDGSKDRTGEILERFAREYPWIRVVHRKDRGQRVPGTGVVETFYDGYDRVESRDWEFIVKLDGDVDLPPDYFARCFQRFDADPKLGMFGGMMYCLKNGVMQSEAQPLFHVRGPIKLYKRACWEAIGGLMKAPGWDTIDEVQANRLGWRTQTDPNLRVLHQRPTGAVQGVWRDGVKMGRAAYICGYHPIFMAAKCVKRAFMKPFLICALAHGYGYMSGYWKRIARVKDSGFIDYLRDQQLRRLLHLESIWK